MGLLLRYCDGIRVIATARRRPALSLAGLRGAGRIVEIGPNDLRLTSRELGELFESSLPPAYLEALRARTDSVAVAAGFARRAFCSPSADGVPWTESLREYYREQIRDSLPGELVPLVSRLSILELFDNSLAHATVGHDVSRELRQLHEEEGLLGIDRRTGLFRFSPLLRESLSGELHWIDEAERRTLHQRAAQWFLQRGFVQEALGHAIAARDARQAFELFQCVGASSVIAKFGLPVLSSVLTEMRNATADRSELVEWSSVLLLSQQGRTPEANALAETLRPSTQVLVSPAHAKHSWSLAEREILFIETLLAMYADLRLPPDRQSVLARVADSITGRDGLQRALIQNALGWVHYEHAELQAAEECASRALAGFTEQGALYASLFVHLHRTLIRFWQNRLDEACSEAKLFRQLQQLFFPSDARLEWLSRVFLATVHLEVGLTEEAERLAENLLEEGSPDNGWFEPQLLAYTTTARVKAAKGDFEGASAILSRGQQFAELRNLPRLTWNLELCRARIRLHAGDVCPPGCLAAIGEGEELPSFFGWREELQSSVFSARIAIATGEYGRARVLVARARAQVRGISVPRARTMVSILEAQFASSLGRTRESNRILEEEMRTFGRARPLRLLAEEGIGLLKGSTAQQATGPAKRAESGFTQLTAREREILDLLSEGKANKRVAERIGISESTVKFHLRNLYRKLGARNRTQAVSRDRGRRRWLAG